MTTIYLIIALTVACVCCQTVKKHHSFPHTESQSYFDEISHARKLIAQHKYLKSAAIQSQLQKVSEAITSFSGLFRKPLQDNKMPTLLKSSGDTNRLDIQEVLKTALEKVAYDNVSLAVCVNDTLHIFTNFIQGQQWAIPFLDSYGKPGPGLTEFRLNFVGSYRQCRSAHGSYNDSSRTFNGNYCTLKANIGLPSPAGQLAIQLGACMPDTCSEYENSLLLTMIIQMLELNGTLTAGSTECHTDEREMTTATVISIVVVVVIGLLAIFGTTFDIIFVQWPKWKASSIEESFMANDLLSHRKRYNDVGDEDEERRNEVKPLLGIGTKKDEKQGFCSKALFAFSVYTNGSKVLDTKQAPGSLGAIHGIRFLSMSWVLLGHTYIFGASQLANMTTEYPALMKRWTFDAIANALVSVDTFFCLSGLLTAYLLLADIKKKGLKLNWPLFYFHRFWRLTPPYMLTLLIVLGFQQYLGSGALWPKVQPADKVNCEKNWWTNLLYINNLANAKEMCFGHSWYMANDMQFFVLSPLMIIPFYFHTYAGVVVCGGFLLISWITTGVLSANHEWHASIIAAQTADPNYAWFLNYYITPWCRIGPYVVGVLAGALLALNHGKVLMSWYTACIGWIVATATALAVVYGLYGEISGENDVSLSVSAFYNSVARSAWGACVCWVIVACVSGQGGFVNSLLSWSPFVVLGRLTYMAYLIHPSLIYAYYQNQEQLYYLTDTSIVITFLGIVVITNLVAFVLMLAFESPWIGLERTFLRQKKKE